MCIGIPMQVAEPRSRYALCRADGESREVDMILVGEQPAGTWVLVFLGAAREVIAGRMQPGSAMRYGRSRSIAQGKTDVDHLFADLTGREPELPEHLRPQAAGFTAMPPSPQPSPRTERGHLRRRYLSPGLYAATLSRGEGTPGQRHVANSHSPRGRGTG